MSEPVPNRANDAKRTVDFYNQQGENTHSADVRYVGTRWQKPHAGDIKKNRREDTTEWRLRDTEGY